LYSRSNASEDGPAIIGWVTGIAIEHPTLHCVWKYHAMFKTNKTLYSIQIIIIITRDLYYVTKCRSKLKGAGHCTSAKRMTSILRHVAEAFPPAKQGTILNSHRVIGIPTDTSLVLSCALVTYLMVTANVGMLDAV